MKKTLPIILKNVKILLIGAGNVAKQKYTVLLENGYLPTIIAIKNIALIPNVIIRTIAIQDCKDFDIIIDASGSKEVCEILFSAKSQYKFLLNRVDKPTDCDFYFASLLSIGELKIAISTNGASPTIGQEVRDFIQRVLPKKIKALLEEKKTQRKQKLINIVKTREQSKHLLGQVYLIGCGIGDVELLTIKAYNLIQEMDIVLIDHLISDEIIDCIPKNTKKIYVGKEKDKLTVRQEDINDILLKYSKQGFRVARLKSGDPYIFGRGAEEAMFLAKNNIRVEVIAGISSAIAGPSSAGIAPTARGYSANLSIVTAHLRGNRVNLDWIDILKIKNHTTVVLMSISRAKEITQKAIEIGIDKMMPTAIISNASRKNQKVFITTLQELPDVAKSVPKPALIVFGDVVNLYNKLPINKMF